MEHYQANLFQQRIDPRFSWYSGFSWTALPKLNGHPHNECCPYSGSTLPNMRETGYWEQGSVDIHDIPIPPRLGPIIAVIIDTPGKYIWKIDKVVIDGRSFLFDNTSRKMFTRFSTHFVLGGHRGEWPLERPIHFSSTITTLQLGHAPNSNTIYLPVGLFKDPVKSHYRDGELFTEPTRPDHEKTVTVRLDFNTKSKNLPRVLQYNNVIGPKLNVQLVNPEGKTSETKKTKGPLIFDQRYVSFKVPGNFEIDHIKVSLPDDIKSAHVGEVGVIIEEGLAGETIFQGNVTLV